MTKNILKEKTYILTNKHLSFSLSPRLSKEELILNIYENKSPASTYEIAYSLNSLITLDKRFRAYDSIEEILREIEIAIDRKNVEIEKRSNFCLLSFIMIGNKISIKIPTTKTLNAGPLHLVKIIEDNSLIISMMCLLLDGRLAFCSRDRKIKIINLQTFEYELKFLPSDYTSDYLFVLDNGNFGCCSQFEGIIRIWEIKGRTYKLLSETEHEKVNKVAQLSQKRIASSSKKNLVIWNDELNFKKKIMNFRYNEAFIELKNNCYIVVYETEKREIYGRLIFFNTKTYEREHIIEDIECNDDVDNLYEAKNKLIFGGGITISIVDTKSFILERKIRIEGLDGLFAYLLIDDETLICGCNIGNDFEGSFLKIHLKRLELLGFQKNIGKTINQIIQINKNSFVTLSRGGQIKIWRF